MSVGRRLLGELFRDNGIHHADSCKSRHPFLGPVSGTTSRIDAYESPAGEVIYICTECRRLAIWKDRVLQPDPIWELEHSRVRSPGVQERAEAAAELERLQERCADDAKESPHAEPPKPRGQRRLRPSAWRIANATVLVYAFRRLKEANGRPPSQERLAEELDVARSTVREAVVKFHLRWPPE